MAEAVARGREVFSVDPGGTALLIIDMQVGFLAEGATYETPAGREMIPNLERLLAFARARELPVIWIRCDSSAPYGGAVLKKLPAVREDHILWPGHDSFEYFRDMAQPVDGEFHVVKHKYDAFFETDLDAILRNLGIQTVIITGVTTSCCCESTARSGFERDYNVAFVRDCTAEVDDAMHEATLRMIDMVIGRVVSAAELLAEMQEPVHDGRASRTDALAPRARPRHLVQPP